MLPLWIVLFWGAGFEHFSTSSAVSLACWAAMSFFYLWQFLVTRYEIVGDDLAVRFGATRVSFPLADIYEVGPTRDLLGSFAWSHDPIRVRYHVNKIVGRFVIISPRDRNAFVSAIAERCPHLERVGELSLKQRLPVSAGIDEHDHHAAIV
jgi:hypothetical protein